jgi:hypothetical protein
MWPLLADTARINEASKLPRQTIEETPQADGSVLYIARAKQGPIRLEWREEPVNWVSNQWFEHCRYFTRGPLSLLCAVLTLSSEGTGSRLDYTVDFDGKRIDVLTESILVDEGTWVRCIDVKAGRVIVREVEAPLDLNAINPEDFKV